MKEENKLQAKDYINIGIFSAVLMVMYLIASVTNLMPAPYLFYSPMTAFLGAIPYMIIAASSCTVSQGFSHRDGAYADY